MRKTKNSIKIVLALTALVVAGSVTGFQPTVDLTNTSHLDDPSLPGSVNDLIDWVEMNPDDIDARQKLALKLYQVGRRNEAIDELHRAGTVIESEWDRALVEFSAGEAPIR